MFPYENLIYRIVMEQFPHKENSSKETLVAHLKSQNIAGQMELITEKPNPTLQTRIRSQYFSSPVICTCNMHLTTIFVISHL